MPRWSRGHLWLTSSQVRVDGRVGGKCECGGCGGGRVLVFDALIAP